MDFNIGETFEVFMAVAILTVAIVMVISASPPNYLHHINKDPTLLWYHLRRADVVQSNRKRQKYFAGHTLSFVANLCFLDPTPYLANFPKFCHFFDAFPNKLHSSVLAEPSAFLALHLRYFLCGINQIDYMDVFANYCHASCALERVCLTKNV